MKAAIFKLLFFLPIISYAQKAPVKFGDVSPEELKMTFYDKDSSASAVVLADYGVAEINYNQSQGFQVNFQRTTRIKILTKDGYEWANFAVALYHEGDNREKLSGLKAVTYNLVNGKLEETKMQSGASFEEKYNKNIDLIKGACPNVKEGSVIEISYRVLSDFLFNFQDWEFQHTIPVVWSEYRARIPEYFNYSKYMQGYVPLFINDEKANPQSLTLTFREQDERSGAFQHSTEKVDFSETSFRWAAKDVPAFKSEPHMTTHKDYISKINFELAFTKFPNQPMKTFMGSWEDISKKFYEYEDCGHQVKANGFLKKIVEEITTGLDTPEKKIAAIYSYVKKNVTWDGSSRVFIESSLKNVLENKKGNSADINLLLASMLEKADFVVAPALISTRDHGFIREQIPVASQFNYVVCVVTLEGKTIVLDATEKLLPINILPERCLNGRGLLVADAGANWVNVESGLKSKNSVTAEMIASPDGKLTGKLQFDRSGYFAHEKRKKYFSKGQDDYVKEIADQELWEIKKSEFKSAEQIPEPFIEIHEVDVNDQATVAGDVIYINPFLTSQITENPFKLEQREYPVDFGSPFDDIYLYKVTVPEDYQVEELPQPKVISLPENAARFRFSATQLGNVISITSMLSINKAIYVQDEYPYLRELYNQVVAKQAEQIVLKKK